ncbi:unnamed protein product [Protopolystoma xenopodis]|uniref:Uncharacterized protein n=1 Tax=Protopolystoma xenopodis TaxID=117903 RepID=A0A3S5A0Y1_9PLAT|nr:unnamed protein product [Protopolystoma xenopodis]
MFITRLIKSGRSSLGSSWHLATDTLYNHFGDGQASHGGCQHQQQKEMHNRHHLHHKLTLQPQSQKRVNKQCLGNQDDVASEAGMPYHQASSKRLINNQADGPPRLSEDETTGSKSTEFQTDSHRQGLPDEQQYYEELPALPTSLVPLLPHSHQGNRYRPQNRPRRFRPRATTLAGEPGSSSLNDTAPYGTQGLQTRALELEPGSTLCIHSGSRFVMRPENWTGPSLSFSGSDVGIVSQTNCPCGSTDSLGSSMNTELLSTPSTSYASPVSLISLKRSPTSAFQLPVPSEYLGSELTDRPCLTEAMSQTSDAEVKVTGSSLKGQKSGFNFHQAIMHSSSRAYGARKIH